MNTYDDEHTSRDSEQGLLPVQHIVRPDMINQASSGEVEAPTDNIYSDNLTPATTPKKTFLQNLNSRFKFEDESKFTRAYIIGLLYVIMVPIVSLMSLIILQVIDDLSGGGGGAGWLFIFFLPFIVAWPVVAVATLALMVLDLIKTRKLSVRFMAGIITFFSLAIFIVGTPTFARRHSINYQKEQLSKSEHQLYFPANLPDEFAVSKAQYRGANGQKRLETYVTAPIGEHLLEQNLDKSNALSPDEYINIEKCEKNIKGTYDALVKKCELGRSSDGRMLMIINGKITWIVDKNESIIFSRVTSTSKGIKKRDTNSYNETEINTIITLLDSLEQVSSDDAITLTCTYKICEDEYGYETISFWDSFLNHQPNLESSR